MAEGSNPGSGTAQQDWIGVQDLAPAWDPMSPASDELDEDEAAKSAQEAEQPEDEREPEQHAEETSDDEAAEDEEHSDAAEDEGEDDTIEVAGKRLTLDELKAGYLRQADYTRKTQELAEWRRTLEEQARTFTQGVERVAQMLQQMLPPQPDPQLAQVDPAEYTRRRAAWEAEAQRVQQLLAAFQEAGQQAEEALNALNEQQLEFEAEKLMEAMPELRDPAKREEFFDTAIEAAKKLGFSEDEIEQVSDHRLYLLAYWAARGLNAQKAAAAARQKVKQSRTSRRSRRSAGEAVKAAQQAMERLRQTGSLDDAAMAIERLIGE